MRAVLDACVLYPTALRQMLLGVAEAGLYEPRWSERILEEWARAAARAGPEAEAVERGEIAVLGARWPRAMVPAAPAREAALWLPDPDDIHVLAAAIEGSADVIVTFNLRDFPGHLLADEGVRALNPDRFLMDLADRDEAAVSEVASALLDRITALSGEDWDTRRLLKRAGLPRLGKRLGAKG